MFMYIGEDQVIQSKDIVSIIDSNAIYSSVIMEEMMAENIKQKRVIGNKENAKSIIITPNEIYYSLLSIPTLKKRSTMLLTLNGLDDYSDDSDTALDSE